MEGVQQQQVADVPVEPVVELQVIESAPIQVVVAEAPAIVAETVMPPPADVQPIVANVQPVVSEETPLPEVVPQVPVVPQVQQVVASTQEQGAAVSTQAQEQVESSVPKDPSLGINAAIALVNKSKHGPTAVKKIPATPKKKRLTGKHLDKIIKLRRGKGLSYHATLFKCERSDLINADGDIRHFGCEALAAIGPFVAGSKIEVIDWLGSANLLFVSQTGKIADTVVLSLNNGALESQTPMEL